MRTIYIGDYFEAELGSGTTFPVFLPDLDNTGLPHKFYLPIIRNGEGTATPPPVNPGNGFFVTHPIHPNQSAITWRMYYSSGDQRVAMRISHGPTTDPYPAPGATQDEVYYLLGDHLGSTTITVNSDGTVKSRVRYDAWGKTRYSSGTTPTDRKYTGQIEEATVGLYFYNARWYDPSLGRFIQADTTVPDLYSSQGWNRYSYSSNNPINFSDPTGHMPTDGCNYEGCNISTFKDYIQVSIYTIDERFTSTYRRQGGFTDKIFTKIYSTDNPITRSAYFEWALERIGGPNTNQALVDLLYIAGNNLSTGMMGLAMGGDVTSIDLYAFGNALGPRPPRLGKDIFADEFGYVGPEMPPLPNGASTFADPGMAPLTGHYYKLPAGSQLPDGVSIIADGVDVNPLSLNPMSHNTIYPSSSMSFVDFVEKFLRLPWIHAGKK